MQTAKELHPQYVTDMAGRQTAVLLPLDEYTGLLEDLDDLAAVAERTDEPTIPHAKVVAELRGSGQLSD
jgi:hypothetical protein